MPLVGSTLAYQVFINGTTVDASSSRVVKESCGPRLVSGRRQAWITSTRGTMRIIPVLDLKAGHVVRARAGRRQDYQPIQSRLTPSSQPQEIAEAFRAQFGFTELYVADLDAIAGTLPALTIHVALRALGFRLWVDAGVRNVTAVEPLLEAGLHKVVVGLETVAGPEALAGICRRIDTDRVVFSLDLKDGLPLGDRCRWQQPDAWSI